MIDLRLYSGAPWPIDVILRFISGWGTDVKGCMHIGAPSTPEVVFGVPDAPLAVFGDGAAAGIALGSAALARASVGDARAPRLVLGPVEVC